jgi:hypothetical protein
MTCAASEVRFVGPFSRRHVNEINFSYGSSTGMAVALLPRNRYGVEDASFVANSDREQTQQPAA